ncbi:MAG: leucine-rich repeat domain-containing protein [Sedimentisphaerales bacterium]|nr:leucine-rich repeat domain-containing protein [Sedimentisphaerales bacterium]
MKTKSILFRCVLSGLFLLTAFFPAAAVRANYVDENILNISFLWAGANSAEGPVYFADANLKTAVEDALGITDPTPTDMLGLFFLNASRKGITNLTGIEHATNLVILYFRENQIRDISQLSGLKNLRELILSQNQLSDISPLSGLTNLQILFLDHNLISNILPLSELKNLRELMLTQNQVGDISPLSGLTSLQGLYLSGNRISDISSLSHLTDLLYVMLDNNVIGNISPLSGLTNIETLRLFNNQISDVSPLSGLTKMKDLHLRNNQIIDISSLSGLVNLEDLDIRSNPLNAEAYNIYIPLIESYGTTVDYDPPFWRTLAISSSDGGYVIEPGEGNFDYANGTIVDISAAADRRYYFLGWTGTAVDAGKVADPYSAVTTVTMDSDYTLEANFEQSEVTIIYVNDDAPGLDIGTSWDNAIDSLQNALLLAYFYDKPVEIRVAGGIYTPDKGIGIATGDSEASFWLIDGVTIKGGYAGLGEPDPDARNIELYESILSGDLEGNDSSSSASRRNNSYHVMTSYDTGRTAVLDGFTISGGYARSGSPNNGGGGLYNERSDATLINCTFIDNEAGMGAGILNVDSNPIFVNCLISMNLAKGGAGGGIHNRNSNPVMLNCVISANTAGRHGGGMLNYQSSPILTNCTFSDNTAENGAGIFNNESSPMLSDCTFLGNLASENGGGIGNDNSSLILLNCKFNQNTANVNGGAIFDNSSIMFGLDEEIFYNNVFISRLNLTNCIFCRNSADQGGAIFWPMYKTILERGEDSISLSEMNLLNCTFYRNIASHAGGAIFADEEYVNSSDISIDPTAYTRATIDSCIFWDNSPDEIYDETDVSISVKYSDIQDGFVGEGNMDLEPLFADPENSDFHLKSQAGRWDPNVERWVIDEVTSSCIDTGDPDISVGLERFPNGGRINMGAYGGTPEASLSIRQSSLLLSKASNPYPPDGAVEVSPYVILSWSPGVNVVSHNIYFGLTDHPEFVCNQIETEFEPPGLLLFPLTEYYWRIDEIDSQGNIMPGDTWIFTLDEYCKGRTCFTGETPVWIDGAAIAMSKVSAGQSIGYNLGKVETVQEHEGEFTLYDIVLESGNCITVAENHFFMSEAGNWISLHELKAGTRLKTSKGSVGITSIIKRPEPYVGKVYNLKIEGSDQYMVGEDAIIVRDY